MEENKKRPLSEEELEQVAGGVQYVTKDGVEGWKCSYCTKIFPTKEEAKEHEATCSYNPNKSNSDYQRLLKPIIL